MCRSNRSKNDDHRTYFIMSWNICYMFVISELERHVDKIQYNSIRYMQESSSDLIYQNFCVWHDPSKNSHHLSRLSCQNYVSHFKERRSTKIRQRNPVLFVRILVECRYRQGMPWKSLEIELIQSEFFVIIFALWRSARKYWWMTLLLTESSSIIIWFVFEKCFTDNWSVWLRMEIMIFTSARKRQKRKIRYLISNRWSLFTRWKEVFRWYDTRCKYNNNWLEDEMDLHFICRLIN